MFLRIGRGQKGNQAPTPQKSGCCSWKWKVNVKSHYDSNNCFYFSRFRHLVAAKTSCTYKSDIMALLWLMYDKIDVSLCIPEIWSNIWGYFSGHSIKSNILSPLAQIFFVSNSSVALLLLNAPRGEPVFHGTGPTLFYMFVCDSCS